METWKGFKLIRNLLSFPFFLFSSFFALNSITFISEVSEG